MHYKSKYVESLEDQYSRELVTFTNCSKIVQDTSAAQKSSARNSEKVAQLKAHFDVIAQLLHEESDPENMKTLESIEMTVRHQIQTHVSPELGHFYLHSYWYGSRPSPTTEKQLGCSNRYNSTGTAPSRFPLLSNQSSFRELLFAHQC